MSERRVIRQNLNDAYLDPEVPISKHEFIERKTRLDDEWSSVLHDIEATEKDIADVLTPEELKTLDRFSAEVCGRLNSKDPLPQEMRKIFELLHIKVIVEVDGHIRLDGWFTPEVDCVGLLSQQSMFLADQNWCLPRHRRPLPPIQSRHRKIRGPA